MATETINPIIHVASLLLHRGADGGAPVTRNDLGYNRVDYPLVRNILESIKRQQGIATRGQLRYLFIILRKYHRQVGELGYDLAMLEAAIAEGAERAPVIAAPQDFIPRESRPGFVTGADEYPDYADPDVSESDTLASGPTIPPMSDVLGPGGVIAQRLPGYEPRPSQIELAQGIADAITDGETILAEAGTGTGKSLAYLIPAIYSGKKTIVSTEGKALQDQLAKKDLPFLRAVLPVDFQFAVLKGIGNYLCRWKWDDEAGKQKMLGESHEFAQLRQWLGETASGDLAEAPVNPSPELRQNITVSSDECLGRTCPYAASCFALQAKERAKNAHVVVVNHTLLTLDLALRDRTDDGVGALPDRDLIVIDEAHSLEDVATKAFTDEIGEFTVHYALRGKLPEKAELAQADLDHARDLNDRFFNILRRDERQTFVVTPTSELENAARDVAVAIRALATQVRKSAMDAIDQNDRRALELYGKRLDELADRFVGILEDADETEILFVEKERTARGRDRILLKRAPVSVADDLRNALWERWPVVATSATLSTNGNFNYFAERTGCPEDVQEIIVDSPFDYQRNALIYLPRDGAAFDPSRFRQDGSVEYYERLAKQIEDLLLASDGRAFCLFTSRKALEEVYGRIAHRLRWNVYKQGDASPQQLVEQFKADGHGVLFGLRSFWAGVDVQGEALSLVVVDKLPFPTPDEPVYQARCDLLNRQHNDQWAWFRRLALPLCTIQFKQAFGRLIRTKTDRGVVALLDGRLTTRSYGVGILKSLPPAIQTRSIDAVKAFFGASA